MRMAYLTLMCRSSAASFASLTLGGDPRQETMAKVRASPSNARGLESAEVGTNIGFTSRSCAALAEVP